MQLHIMLLMRQRIEQLRLETDADARTVVGNFGRQSVVIATALPQS